MTTLFLLAQTTDAATLPWIPAQSPLAVQLLLDALFAALAGMGFGAISNPPKRLLFVSGILAAFGHALRTFLMLAFGWDVVSATLVGAFAIGLGGFVAGQISGNPSEVFSFPALLPFIPGMKAYYAVLALLRLLRCGGEGAAAQHCVYEFFSNAIVAIFVLVAIVIGASLAVFIDTYSVKRRRLRVLAFQRSRR